jgi:hypothetical protein
LPLLTSKLWKKVLSFSSPSVEDCSTCLLGVPLGVDVREIKGRVTNGEEFGAGESISDEYGEKFSAPGVEVRLDGVGSLSYQLTRISQ